MPAPSEHHDAVVDRIKQECKRCGDNDSIDVGGQDAVGGVERSNQQEQKKIPSWVFLIFRGTGVFHSDIIAYDYDEITP